MRFIQIGLLCKLLSTLDNQQRVIYHLPFENNIICLNKYLNRPIYLKFTGEIYCIHCNRKIRKSFQQGYCFPCYKRLLECNLCIIYPEKCRYYEGICQPADWAHAHCIQPHVVYLANSSGLKVGITRANQIPTRWIDQGATQGLIMFSVQNRHQAGLMEVLLKKWVADKTNWRTMLKMNSPALNLLEKYEILAFHTQADRETLAAQFPGEINTISNPTTLQINYPVLHYPVRITTLNLDKQNLIMGKLQGIKGQYLLLDTGVFSVRKFAGYQIELTID